MQWLQEAVKLKEKTETDSPHMIDPRIPSIEKTSANSIEVVTNIADAKYCWRDGTSPLLEDYAQ